MILPKKVQTSTKTRVFALFSVKNMGRNRYRIRREFWSQNFTQFLSANFACYSKGQAA